jgi:hypothetical protein
MLSSGFQKIRSHDFLLMNLQIPDQRMHLVERRRVDHDHLRYLEMQKKQLNSVLTKQTTIIQTLSFQFKRKLKYDFKKWSDCTLTAWMTTRKGQTNQQDKKTESKASYG